MIIQSQEAWTPVGATKAFPAGSLLSVDLAALKADPARLKPTLIYAPAAREALQGASATKGMLLVSILDNVRGRTLLFKPGPNGSWKRSALDLPDNSTIGIADTSHTDDRALLGVTSFLTPPSQWLVDAAAGSAKQIPRATGEIRCVRPGRPSNMRRRRATAPRCPISWSTVPT